MEIKQSKKETSRLLGAIFIVIAAVIIGMVVSSCAEVLHPNQTILNPAAQETAEEIKDHDEYCKTNKCDFAYGETDASRIPLAFRTGYIPDPNRFLGAQFAALEIKEVMPAEYDLRKQGIAPVRNQGGCGSCWAFGTSAVVEDLIALHDKKQIEIAKQYMVDCAPQNYYGCSGGDFAFKKLMEPKGTVYEADYPVKYSASNRKCQAAWLASHDYKERIESYGYVGAFDTLLRRAEPSTAQIQAAIMKYGPVGMTVAAGGLGSYKSGFYDNCKSGPTNHIVTVVGWVTHNGQVYWIMKNSWGTTWGENGYGYILAEKNGQKCNRLGEDEVAYAVYKPACSPQPVSAAGPDHVLIKIGNPFVQIGTKALPDTTYQWSPAEFVVDPKAAVTMANPKKTTVFKLTATTKCGSVESLVTVRVFSEGREVTE